MNTWERAGTLLAILLAGGGLVLPEVTTFEVSRTVIIPVLYLALMLVSWSILRRKLTTEKESLSGAPEQPHPHRVPGETFDIELTDQSRTQTRETSYAKTRIRERLEAVALDMFTGYGGLTRTEAETLITTGDWTADPFASIFLRGDSIPPITVAERLFRPLSAPNPFVRGVRHTLRALTEYTGKPADNPGRQTSFQRTTAWLLNRESVPISLKNELQTPGEVSLTSSETRSLNRWAGFIVFALASLGAGLLLDAPGMILLSGIGLGYVAYSHIGVPGSPDITVDRSLETNTPKPGESLTVTVTIQNTGSRVFPDLRIVDGTPPHLGVETGSPRYSTVLPPGDEAKFSYTVVARRGVHEFRQVRVATHNLAESRATINSIQVDSTIKCRPVFRSPHTFPLRKAVSQYVGQVPTTSGGRGLEFHSTQEYHRGDPPARIDWHRFARTRDLATVVDREERAAEIMCVIDARPHAYVAPTADSPSAVDRAIEATGQLIPTLLETGNRVGIAAFSPIDCWVGPKAGRNAAPHLQERLTTHSAFPQIAPEGRCSTIDWVEEFTRRYDRPTQVILLSPLVDRSAVLLARQLDGHRFLTTVVSVDPTVTLTPGQSLEHLERMTRSRALRKSGIRVVDWAWDDSFARAAFRAQQRWSR